MPRIFLLEDEPAMAQLVRVRVELEKWDLLWHEKVAGAVEALRRFGADLALLDLALPDGNGLSVCRSIKNDAKLSRIPVIIVTSKGDPDSRLKGFQFGCQDYVLKPFLLQELMARVCAHLAIKARVESLERDVMADRLHDRVRQDVIDMVVHDLKTPLSTLKVTLEIIRLQGLITQEPYSDYMHDAETSVEFALFLVNDLLDLRAGKLSVDFKPLDLEAVLSRIDLLLRVQYAAKGVALVKDLPRDGTPIVTDMVLVFRILVNLLSNSLRFSRPGEAVVLKGRRTEGGGLRLEVSDSGPGVPPAELENIFKNFHRAVNAESPLVPGSGVGLAFCRLAAETLGGRIWTENRADGPGSRFIVELPLRPPESR